MTAETRRETTPEMYIAAEVFNVLQPVEERIRKYYPTARFKLTNSYELLVFTETPLNELLKDIINDNLKVIGGFSLSTHNLKEYNDSSKSSS